MHYVDQGLRSNVYELLGSLKEPKRVWQYYIKTQANEGREAILVEELARRFFPFTDIVYSNTGAKPYTVQNYHACVEANHIASRTFCYDPQNIEGIQCLRMQNESNATATATIREMLERFYDRRLIRPIPVIYYNEKGKVERLLGTVGVRVLKCVLDLIADSFSTRDWPLQKVEISHVNDPEITTWEYVLFVFKFDCDFDSADNYLHEFYQELDNLTKRLNHEEQSIIQGVLFFDIETIDNISSY
ncbi:hypothetical protein ES703_90191 [subsurface metagenome]